MRSFEMSMKRKSSTKQDSFEYTSQDGDQWDFMILQQDEKRYVQFSKVGADRPPIVMDGPMLLEMADEYRRCTSLVPAGNLSAGDLQTPDIIDHRSESQSDKIQSQVDESMTNLDSQAPPIQSFGPQPEADYDQFRTGVDAGSLGKVGETPPEWSPEDKSEEELAQWQKDAKARQVKAKVKPQDLI